MTKDIPEGDRIAKVLSRAGVASRREAERMIAEGRVRVNSKVIDSPALNITANDRVSVDGKLIAEPEPARLWLYHKPAGLVTSTSDEKGRQTVFDTFPEDMPRVMSVGRLDLTSEGLLLLTNDGELKRKLELPSTGWLRKYRVRIKGSVSEEKLDQLRKGITVEDLTYQPMQVTFDRQQGANAWLTIALREGKNREIRRAMEELGVIVNRLIRVSYGPFQLGSLKEGEVEEVKRRVLRDQLGWDADMQPTTEPRGKPTRTRKADPTESRAAGAGRGPAAKSGAPRAARPESATSEPKRFTASKSEPSRFSSSKFAPAKSGPIKTGPAKPASTRGAPAKTGPARPRSPATGPRPPRPAGKK